MNSFDENSLITLHETVEDRSQDFCPKTFDDYLGQKELKDKLAIYTQAAKMRGEPLDHLLLFGPPGVGKTTLAQIMAHVMNVGIKIISGPMLERTGDLVAILSSLDNRDILFIDEIHRMSAHVEEVLYSAMEHFRVDVIIGQGAGAKSINLPINPFTLVGATTKSGMISAPLRTRFGIVERIDFYNDEDLAHIVLQNAQFLSMQLDYACAAVVGKCARGTPRIAKKLLRRIRDFAQVTNKNIIDQQLISNALQFLGIDADGLTALDNLMLQRMIEHFNGGPVGLETLAALLGEDRETIEEVYEPYLLRKGYIEKTARGRQIPAKKLPFLKQKFLGQNTLV